MRALVWIFRAFVFLALFAFALNNQQHASVNGFFGTGWEAPMVFIVLAAFGLGCAFGIVAMVPSWWRHRRTARREAAARSALATTPAPTVAGTRPGSLDPTLTHPPLDGL